MMVLPVNPGVIKVVSLSIRPRDNWDRGQFGRETIISLTLAPWCTVRVGFSH